MILMASFHMDIFQSFISHFSEFFDEIILIHTLVDYWINYNISHISYSIFIDPCKETKGSHGSTIGQLREAEEESTYPCNIQ